MTPVVGFGALTHAGWGPGRTVYSLASHGRGSLAYACSFPGAWVRFIDWLEGPLVFTEEITPAEGVFIDGPGERVPFTNGGGRTPAGLVFKAGHGMVHNVLFDGWGDGQNPTRTQPYPFPVYFESGRDYVLDHCTFRDNGGKVSIARAPDVSIQWCHWEPQYKGVQVGSDAVMDEGANNRVTMHHNWFDQVAMRAPRVKAGTVHKFNDLHTGWETSAVYALCHGKVLSEHCVYDDDRPAILTRNNAQGDDRRPACEGNGAVRSVGDLFLSGAFARLGDPRLVEDPPYAYKVDPVDHVSELVRGGAGVLS